MPRAAGLTVVALLLLASAARAQGEGGPTIHVMGFGDVNYLATEREIPGGFLLGQGVLHANAVLTDRLAFFGELSATARPTGFNLELERMILRYDFSDLFKLSLGRYHTPVSFWNVAYHHGLWLQTSVARPEMVKFGSRFLPVHFVGLLAEGGPASPLGVGYAAGIGNGRHSNIARAGDAGDVNQHRAITLTLFLRPPALLGLQLGGSAYLDRATPETGPEMDERILSAHLAREREDPEFLAEYARLTHDPTGGGESLTSDAYYLQLAYRLPGAAHAFKPYARLERLSGADADPLLAPVHTDYTAGIAGLRYDFAPFAALKAEYRNERFGAPERFHSLYLQASFVLPNIAGGGGAMHVSRLERALSTSPFARISAR